MLPHDQVIQNDEPPSADEEDIEEEKTPLEIKINNFVKKLILAGAIVFVLFWLLNFLKSHDILGSLLQALTLAMSILPEVFTGAFVPTENCVRLHQVNQLSVLHLFQHLLSLLHGKFLTYPVHPATPHPLAINVDKI